MLTNSLQHPGAPLTNFNVGGGGPTEVHILYPKKSQVQNLSTQKKSLLFFSIPKKALSPFFTTKKIPLFFFAAQNNPGVFRRPKKKSLLAKFQTPKNHPDPPPPPVIKICEWSPWAPARCATVKTRIKVEGRVVRVIVHPPTRCEECEESRKRSFRCICFLKRRYFK